MLKVHKLTVGVMQSNCYIVSINSNCIIIDPGDEADYISGFINKLRLKPKLIISTHGHFDHNMASYELSSNHKIPFYLSTKDVFLINRMPKSANIWLKRKDVIKPTIKTFKSENLIFRPCKIDIIKTPGHTPGSVSFYFKNENIIFSGDLIFEGNGLGRVDFPYSKKEDFEKSLQIILRLPKETVVYPGHGEKFSLSEISFNTEVSSNN
jgi:glyoxylase-like metal-dependent hydrolase (beta-lactamase superfamily II)